MGLFLSFFPFGCLMAPVSPGWESGWGFPVTSELYLFCALIVCAQIISETRNDVLSNSKKGKYSPGICHWYVRLLRYDNFKLESASTRFCSAHWTRCKITFHRYFLGVKLRKKKRRILSRTESSTNVGGKKNRKENRCLYNRNRLRASFWVKNPKIDILKLRTTMKMLNFTQVFRIGMHLCFFVTWSIRRHRT